MNDMDYLNEIIGATPIKIPYNVIRNDKDLQDLITLINSVFDIRSITDLFVYFITLLDAYEWNKDIDTSYDGDICAKSIIDDILYRIKEYEKGYVDFGSDKLHYVKCPICNKMVYVDDCITELIDRNETLQLKVDGMMDLKEPEYIESLKEKIEELEDKIIDYENNWIDPDNNDPEPPEQDPNH